MRKRQYMKEEKEEKKTGLNGIQNMTFTTLIIVFFVGVIIVYYLMLYSETRENIIKNGEINAISSAELIDKYLSTGVDVIRLTGYNLDNMLQENRSTDEMLDYLVNQSVAAANILSGNSTGIYGYINGEYLDGVGWVPDDDYVPTERPWYIDAQAESGRVVVVDPYLDEQTGTVMITLAKTLCDEKSVVAVDISLEELQSITEDLAVHGESDMEIILDHKYNVIAHSDKNEIGKNYNDEIGTIGKAVAETLKISDNSYFSLKYENTEFIVYSKQIENDWTCLSVIDATSIFDRLKLPFMLTIVAAVLIVMILLFIMIRSNKKSLLAEKMRALADQQTKFAYYDQMTGLKNRRAYSEVIDNYPADNLENTCVIVVDVNGLKRVNDSLGHEAGDELIIAVSECIRSSFPNVDSIYRLGGDEFCIIITEKTENAEEYVKKFESIASSWNGRYINGISVSCGISRGKNHTDIYSVLKEADQRMYENKRSYYSSAGHDRRLSRR